MLGVPSSGPGYRSAFASGASSFDRAGRAHAISMEKSNGCSEPRLKSSGPLSTWAIRSWKTGSGNLLMSDNIGELLVENGCLTKPDLDRALKLQAETDQRLGSFLVSSGLVAERDLAKALAEALGMEVVPSHAYGDSSALQGLVSADFLRNAHAIPVRDDADHVVVAMGDPSDTYTVDALRLALGRPVVVQVGVISEIEAAIERQYGEGSVSLAQIDRDADGENDRDLEDVQQLRELASEAPVIRMVNLLITRALEAGVSDIHLEPYPGRLSVRYRIDGLLRDVDAPPARSTAAVISRIKVMANLNIAERRLPQDGRIRMRVAGREVDMRVSSVPTMHGESVVMRLLDKEGVPLDFPALGYRGQTLEALRRFLAKPHGIVLVTGPTGSGMTTTLYAARRAGSKRCAAGHRGISPEDEESEDSLFAVESRRV